MRLVKANINVGNNKEEIRRKLPDSCSESIRDRCGWMIRKG